MKRQELEKKIDDFKTPMTIKEALELKIIVISLCGEKSILSCEAPDLIRKISERLVIDLQSIIQKSNNTKELSELLIEIKSNLNIIFSQAQIDLLENKLIAKKQTLLR